MRKIFLFLFMAVFTLTVSAQEEEEFATTIVDSPYRIYLGPKAGVNFASMTGLSDEFGLNPKSGIGFQGGLAAGIHFGRRTPKAEGGTGRFGIQLEAMYSQRTIKTDYENLKLSYFEVPILAQYFVMPELSIELGPTICGTLNSSPEKIQSGNIVIQTEEIKGYDVMLTAGIGYKSKNGFTASARYNLGMSELAGNFNGKVSTVTVSVGWLFNLIK
ncbi:porin family protein [Bacteroides sp. ET489]|jgi:hypothetical protein|uniref:porin family protein n=1 Tax=Bacteroides sp. ET489 TaxID=3057126 RepID=UPI002672B861|nr:porin family protein [Bacteroides sp. ET489]MDO3389625.1 porin family protein [Bacteroides sp. ET489]